MVGTVITKLQAKQMSALIKKGMSYLKEDGAIATSKKAVIWGLRRLRIMKVDAVFHRRVEISKNLDRLFNSTVKYGPFHGLKLTTEAWWSETDRAAQLLGLYEQEILESLERIPDEYDVFIDLGAADGYYGIGVLINNLFKRSYCFEQNLTSRKLIEKNAISNDVRDRIEIRGFASKTFYKEIPSDIIDRSVLFIDIEGAEFNLLDKETFQAFSKSIVFIELHEWFFEDGDEKVQKLRNDAAATHKATELTMTSRDLSKFGELKKLHDDDRWLICSEGRGQMMTWLRFEPICR
jgi:Methyltransferase FkbM domain